MRLLQSESDRQRALEALTSSDLAAELLERRDADVVARRRAILAEVDELRAIAATEAKRADQAKVFARKRLEQAEAELEAARLANAEAWSLDTSAARAASIGKRMAEFHDLAAPEVWALRRELRDLEAAGMGRRVTEWSPRRNEDPPNDRLVARPIRIWGRERVTRQSPFHKEERRWETNGPAVGRYVAAVRAAIAAVDSLELEVLPRAEVLSRLAAIRRSIPSIDTTQTADQERAS